MLAALLFRKGGSSASRRSNGEQGAPLPVEECSFHMFS
jgi:hypothetical protein